MPKATESEIRRIYRETLDDFYGIVSRRVDGDRSLAEDVVQETWLRAVRTWQTTGLPEKPSAWLTAVALRIVADHFRRQKPGSIEEAADVPAVDSSDRHARRSLIERALSRLPRMQGRLLEAFHLDDRSVADIAGEHGLSERAVEGRLRRARENLRHEIEKTGEH